MLINQFIDSKLGTYTTEFINPPVCRVVCDKNVYMR